MKSYDKYKAMSPEELQKKIDEGKVSIGYLNWLGITGPGQQLREIVKKEGKSNEKEA